MGRYVIQRHITASPEQVFRAFTEPELVVDWLDAQAILDASGPLDRQGTTYRFVIFRFHAFEVTVVRSDSPRVHQTHGSGRFGWFRLTANLTSRDGGTDLELLTEYGLPLGAIGRWIDRRWIDREPRAQANREVDRLVAITSGSGSTIGTPALAGPADA